MPRFGGIEFSSEDVEITERLTKFWTWDACDNFFVDPDRLGMLLPGGTQFGDVVERGIVIRHRLQRG